MYLLPPTLDCYLKSWNAIVLWLSIVVPAFFMLRVSGSGSLTCFSLMVFVSTYLSVFSFFICSFFFLSSFCQQPSYSSPLYFFKKSLSKFPSCLFLPFQDTMHSRQYKNIYFITLRKNTVIFQDFHLHQGLLNIYCTSFQSWGFISVTVSREEKKSKPECLSSSFQSLPECR